MSNRIFATLCLLMIFGGNVFAQKTLKVSDTYVYRAPTNISVDQAKINAVEQAKLYIIAQNFGTVIGVSNTAVTKNRNGMTNSQFVSFAESDVKGEWLETIGEPQIELDYDQKVQGFMISVTIKGVIREIVSAGTDISAKILRNSIDEKSESDTFSNGDDFFVYFLSPVDGYLTIYMYDMNNMVRLWPRAGSDDGAQKIEAANPYVFFQGARTVDGIRSIYHLTAETATDINRIYIVFSPRPFSHPNDKMMGEYPVMSFDDFHSWLSKARKSDYSMIVIPKDIVINK